MKKLKIFTASILAAILLASCSGQTVETATPVVPVEEGKEVQDKLEESQGPGIPENPVEQEKIEVDYNSIKANEAGKIMVLMYHGIGEKEEEWVRTVENFKKDLQILYEKGYRTISLRDYVNNNITTPPGYTPVVITFDDGNKNQFNIIEKDGKFEIDANCAVSIMKEFGNTHPEFGNAATFFVYYPVPFRQKEKIKEKFQYLIDNGFDIGNHSYTHEALGKMDSEGIQKQITLNIKEAKNYLPNYTVDTLALPYGSRPKDEALRALLLKGEYEGISYENKAVLLVGSNPAPAPNNKEFNPGAIPRIRASEMKTEGTGIYDWLKYFDKNPDERYISDGDPSVVAVPKDKEDMLNKDSLGDKKLVLY